MNTYTLLIVEWYPSNRSSCDKKFKCPLQGCLLILFGLQWIISVNTHAVFFLCLSVQFLLNIFKPTLQEADQQTLSDSSSAVFVCLLSGVCFQTNEQHSFLMWSDALVDTGLRRRSWWLNLDIWETSVYLLALQLHCRFSKFIEFPAWMSYDRDLQYILWLLGLFCHLSLWDFTYLWLFPRKQKVIRPSSNQTVFEVDRSVETDLSWPSITMGFFFLLSPCFKEKKKEQNNIVLLFSVTGDCRGTTTVL